MIIKWSGLCFMCFIVVCVQLYIIWCYKYRDQQDNKLTSKQRNTIPGIVTKSGINKRFYIYEWPEDIVSAIPQKYAHSRLSITADFLLNYGAGNRLDAHIGLYHTHQYSLFLLVYNKLLKSPFRTLDPERADLFFIPYDLGMDSSTRSSDGALTRTNCPRVSYVMKLLKASHYFQKYNGRRHILVHSINHMMRYFANEQCTQLYQMCFNCTKLSIDVYSELTYPTLRAEPHMTHDWLSVPFPSNHHQSRAALHPLWTDALLGTQRAHADGRTVYEHERPHLLCFVGTEQVTARKQRLLRAEIVRQFALRNTSEFLFVPLASHYSTVEVISVGGHTKVSSPYAASRLCLMPGGDFPTRKAFLDAMLSGCVPVTFELEAAQHQWPLHWGDRQTALDCSVFLPREQAMRNMSAALDSLLALSRDVKLMRNKLRAIARVAHRFQYSIPENQQDLDTVKEDALDVILRHLSSQSFL